VKQLGLLLLLSLLSACALPPQSKPEPEPPPAESNPPFRALGESIAAPETREETPDDESIGREVRRRLNLLGPAIAAGIVVEVENGVVTLSGSASTTTAAWRAEAAANAVPGVKRVVNLVIARQAAPLP
jgi:hypothetical protein